MFSKHVKIPQVHDVFIFKSFFQFFDVKELLQLLVHSHKNSIQVFFKVFYKCSSTKE